MFVFCCLYQVYMASFVYSTSFKLSECILCSSYPTAGMSCFPNDRSIFFAILHKYLRSVAKSTCRRQMRSKDINKHKHPQNWPKLHRQWPSISELMMACCNMFFCIFLDADTGIHVNTMKILKSHPVVNLGGLVLFQDRWQEKQERRRWATATVCKQRHLCSWDRCHPS